MTAVAWDPAKHPRHPSGSDRGGEFAPKEIATSVENAQTEGGRAYLAEDEVFRRGESINAFWNPELDRGGGKGDWELKLSSDWRRIDPSEPHVYADLWPEVYKGWTDKFGSEPVLIDTSPPNPRGAADFVKKWIVGRGGQDSFPWFTELRAEYAAQMGLPDPGITRTWHPHEGRPPRPDELRKATQQFIETMAKAKPEQPALWRGLEDVGDPWASTVASAKPGDTLDMLPASYSRSPVKASQYVSTHEKKGVMMYVLPGSRGLADKRPWLRDEEVIAAGRYEVLASETVNPVERSKQEWRGKHPIQVVTVRQINARPGSLTAAAWVESKHPRHPAGTDKGGEFSPARERDFINQVREAEHAERKGFPPGEFTPDEKVQFWPQKIGYRDGPAWKAWLDPKTGKELAFWFVNPVGFPHHMDMARELGIDPPKLDEVLVGPLRVSGYGNEPDMGWMSSYFRDDLGVNRDEMQRLGRTGNQLHDMIMGSVNDMARRHRKDIEDADIVAHGPLAMAASALFEQVAEAEAELQRQYEKVLRRAAKRAATQYRAAMKVVTAAGQPQPEEILAAQALLESFLRVTGVARRNLLNEILQALGVLHADAETPNDAIAAYIELLQEQAGVQAARLVAGTQDAVADVLLDAMDQGWPVPQTATALREKLEGVAPWQATMLARTDMVALANGASLKRAVMLDSPELQFKTWLATPDERTRIDHRHAHGQTVPIVEPFTVGGEQLLYPGDPSASDGNVINCRCTVIYSDTPFGPPGIQQIAMLPDLAVSAAAFVEAEHPRHPAGTEAGGEFAGKEAALEEYAARDSLYRTYDRWAQGLAKPQKDAFQAWRSEVYYQDMNQLMRGKDPADFKGDDYTQVYDYTETLRKTMFEAPKIQQPIKVWRGVDATTLTEAAGVSSVDELVGKTLYDDGFRATTLHGGLESQYGDTSISITVPKGYPAIWASAVEQAVDKDWLKGMEDWEVDAYDSELVLPPGGFKVTGVRRNKQGHVTLEAEAVDPW